MEVIRFIYLLLGQPSFSNSSYESWNLKPNISTYRVFYDKVLQTGWLINSRHSHLKVLRLQVLDHGANTVIFWRGFFSSCRLSASSCILKWWQESRAALGDLCKMALTPSQGAHSLDHVTFYILVWDRRAVGLRFKHGDLGDKRKHVFLNPWWNCIPIRASQVVNGIHWKSVYYI